MRDLSHQNTQPKTHHNSTNLQVNLGLLSLTLMLALVYIFSANAMATTGFQIKKLSVELSDLEAQHKKLELENSTLQAVSTIQQKTAQLNFVPSTSVSYIKDDNFALK
ncbi:MAG: hypothetical protein KW788_01635 [Candidatus Doudnabacteria bacterium]|nr:hypothetical protein [Candidatus Doudnabacteria bacterium]